MNQATTTATQQLTVRPTKRGVRVWLEDSPNNPRLTTAGFVKGATYTREIKDGVIVMRLTDGGKKRVSGKAKPIIDISAKQLDGFTPNQEVTATYQFGLIIIK
jgi:hypothetical protein